jgi:hypothetical protein
VHICHTKVGEVPIEVDWQAYWKDEELEIGKAKGV